MNGQAYIGTALKRFVTAGLLCVFIFLGESNAETAIYEVTFDAVWSRETHPDRFPGSPHFSVLSGGAHNDKVSFWEVGELASRGVELMAEEGATIRGNVAAAARTGNAHLPLMGPPVRRSPQTITYEFEVTDAFPLITLVSMVAPSPDWFVGTSGYDLRPNGEWLDQGVYELWPYDAGTDSGTIFSSPDEDTAPAEPISPITQAPFENTPPLGTFTFTRILPWDYHKNGGYDAADINRLSQALRIGSTDEAFDVNADGIVNAGDRLAWLDIADIRPGDSDFSGDFNSSDLVMIFQAGEYEDRIVGNSGWDEGDFDGDGEAESSDLVLAMQVGGYENDIGAIPEPSGAGLLLMGGLLLRPLWRRRRDAHER